MQRKTPLGRVLENWFDGYCALSSHAVEYSYQLNEVETGSEDDYHSIYTEIYDAEVTAVNPAAIAQSVISSTGFRRKRDEVTRRRDGYLLERAIVSAQLSSEDFEVVVIPDYYGDTISKLELTAPDKLEQILHALEPAPKTDTEAVQRALQLEYGHLLPQLQGKRFRATRVKMSDLDFPHSTHNSAHVNNLSQTVFDQYDRTPFRLDPLGSNDKRMPQGVVIAEPNGKYRVLDGYHRLGVAQADGKRMIDVWRAV